MLRLLESLNVSGQQYIPHGHCYLWQSNLLWLHILSDILITLAYFSIPLALIYFVREKEDIPFKTIFVLFSLFIFSCGTTHLMSVWTLWHPDYWLSGLIKAITAIISLITAFELIPTLPKALAMRSPLELELANQALELEITNRKKAESALQELNANLESIVEQRTNEYRESERKFRSLFEAAPDFIYLLNLQGEIEQVNPAVIDKSGYSESELIASPLINFLSFNSQKYCEDKLSTLLDQGESRQEMEFVCKNEQILTMDCSCSVVRSPQNDDAYLLVLQRDISDRKRNEQALEVINQKLRESNAELEKFAYLASHDLREPLRMVTSFTQLLAQRYGNRLDAEAEQIIGFAVEGASRMEELINDLLEYSRVDKNDDSYILVDCDELLDHALNNLQVSLQSSGVEIIRSPLPTIFGNSIQLVQLWQNLLDNAIVYRSPESAKITIRAVEREKEWLFEVEDNGIGIAPKYQKRIFQIFQRLHTKEAYPGTGIGLAICHKIVERHGGEIGVRSKLGEGATFYFTLPK